MTRDTAWEIPRGWKRPETRPLASQPAVAGKTFDAGLVSADMVREGGVVVDVGMNRGEAGLVGDVDPGALERAALMTPVPGGVGPMTIACLLDNAVRCARYRTGELDYPG